MDKIAKIPFKKKVKFNTKIDKSANVCHNADYCGYCMYYEYCNVNGTLEFTASPCTAYIESY